MLLKSNAQPTCCPPPNDAPTVRAGKAPLRWDSAPLGKRQFLCASSMAAVALSFVDAQDASSGCPAHIPIVRWLLSRIGVGALSNDIELATQYQYRACHMYCPSHFQSSNL